MSKPASLGQQTYFAVVWTEDEEGHETWEVQWCETLSDAISARSKGGANGVTHVDLYLATML